VHRKLGTRVCCEAVRSAILATAWLLVLVGKPHPIAKLNSEICCSEEKRPDSFCRIWKVVFFGILDVRLFRYF